MIVDAYVSRIPCQRVLTAPFSEDEDEETREWEEAQLRRGGLQPEAAEPAPKPVYKPAPSMIVLAFHPISKLTLFTVPAITPIPTMGAAMARLTNSMSELTMSHAEHSAAMSKLGEKEAKSIALR